jgi:hypothetical protein
MSRLDVSQVRDPREWWEDRKSQVMEHREPMTWTELATTLDGDRGKTLTRAVLNQVMASLPVPTSKVGSVSIVLRVRLTPVTSDETFKGGVGWCGGVTRETGIESEELGMSVPTTQEVCGIFVNGR